MSFNLAKNRYGRLNSTRLKPFRALARNLVAGGLLAASLVSVPQRAHAWAGGGHMVVASIAYQDLSPATKQKVDVLLKAHPAASRWADSVLTPQASGLDKGAFAFLHASVWPDEIRGAGSPYDHPNWHYVDYLLSPPYQSLPLVISEPSPQDDVLYGIATSEHTLSDSHASAPDRAAALAWLIHLVGDVHQPLHCATFVDGQRFVAPEGDRGGNKAFVSYAGHSYKLHAFWDEEMTKSKDTNWATGQAVDLLHKWPRQSWSILHVDSTPKSWSVESFGLAVSKGYLNGALECGTDLDHATAVTDSYAKDAKVTSERQITLAGYRLADEITRLLG